MDRKPQSSPTGKGVETREARLKSALKANIAKRKAQARARGEKSGTLDGAGHKKEG